MEEEVRDWMKKKLKEAGLREVPEISTGKYAAEVEKTPEVEEGAKKEEIQEEVESEKVEEQTSSVDVNEKIAEFLHRPSAAEEAQKAQEAEGQEDTNHQETVTLKANTKSQAPESPNQKIEISELSLLNPKHKNFNKKRILIVVLSGVAGALVGMLVYLFLLR